MFTKINTGLLSVLILLWHCNASGFRNCDVEDSDAWAAASGYTVGELDFDDTTGLASGTETFYNYSNTYPNGGGECHVTYELSGNYVAGVEVFTLSGTRSNYSDSCPPELLRIEYPAIVLHSFQMEIAEDGSAVLHSGDSGEILADGSLRPGSATYTTGEKCTAF